MIKTDNNNFNIFSSQFGIQVQNISFKYKDKLIFDNFSLDFPPNKTTSILGNNGIGKSTLLKLLSGLEKPLKGTILNYEQKSICKSISYMGQSDQLLPWANIKDNITLGYKLRKEKFPKAMLDNLTRILKLTGFLNHLPKELSGGTKQRTALARTLIENKPIILMDEPFSSLDTITKKNLRNLTKSLIRNRTLVLVTHDIIEALELSHQIIIFRGSPVKVHKVFKLDNSTADKKNNDITIDNYNNILKALI